MTWLTVLIAVVVVVAVAAICRVALAFRRLTQNLSKRRAVHHIRVVV